MKRSDPLIRQLADANPVPLQELDGAYRSTSADEMLIKVLDLDRRPLALKGGPRRKRGIVAASLSLLCVTVVMLIFRGGGDAPASASEVLLRTAAIAADREAQRQEDPYLYSKVESEQRTTSDENGRGWSVILPFVEESWVATDGSGRILSSIEPQRFFGPRDQQRWEEAGELPSPSGVSDDLFPPGFLPYEDLSLLPTRPSALDTILRNNVSSEDLPSDVGVFLRAGRLLASGGASPELRATLYRVASQLPGVELIGDTIDPSGRPGVAVAMTYSDSGAEVQVVMIFDAETSALLAQESILLERASWVDAAPGTRLSYVTYLEAGWTESVFDTPGQSEG